MTVPPECRDVDLYAVLGLEAAADKKAVKAAYRRLARAHHPDARRGDETAAERFRLLTLARDVLTNPGRRADYDRARPAGSSPSTPPPPPSPSSPAPAPPATVTVPLARSLSGGCVDVVVDGRSWTVPVPAGTRSGDRLRAISRDSGEEVGVVAVVDRDSVFDTLDGAVSCRVGISYTQAVLGGTVVLHDPIGREVAIEVPPGTASHTVVRLAGHLGADLDLLVRVEVEVPHPDGLSSSERWVIGELGRLEAMR